ncbi:hypothetical protein [Palleronia aestuarii]|uniref:hypothetical protein n=1 Tax=Palleronia aestuarii TaxID=568105 RepID=UPI001B873AD4|nr:hypothetical protein [Palleronia aestuarii]
MNVVANAPGEGFTVDWAGASGASDFWCAAGEFAIRGLGLPTGTRLYRYSAPPRRSGEGIAFGLDPARGQPTGLLRVAGGQSVTAAYARRFCEFSRFSDR